jgi:hypothetical protein
LVATAIGACATPEPPPHIPIAVSTPSPLPPAKAEWPYILDCTEVPRDECERRADEIAPHGHVNTQESADPNAPTPAVRRLVRLRIQSNGDVSIEFSDGTAAYIVTD